MAQDPPPPTLEPGLLTAAKLLAWRGGAPDLSALRGVVVTHDGALVRAMTSRWQRKSLRGLSAELLVLPPGDVAVGRGLHVGGSAMAVLVEELAACGVRAIVGVDIAGSIDPGLPSGSVAVIEKALIGDGTSPHYAPDSSTVSADEALSQRLRAALESEAAAVKTATVWSTDAPFRETASEIALYHARSAGLVDMETAALFAAARALGVAAAAVLVAADELFEEWRPPGAMNEVRLRLEGAGRAAVRALRA